MHSRQPEPHPASEPAADFQTREILGVPVAMVDYDRAIAVMDRLIERRERGYVCAAPVHALMVAQDDPEMLAALRGSTMVVPDGMPVVWAANLLGERLARSRLRPRADAALLAALGRPRAPRVALRRP